MVSERPRFRRHDEERGRVAQHDHPVLRLADDLRPRVDFRRLHLKISVGVEKELRVLSVGEGGEQENECRSRGAQANPKGIPA